MYLKRFKVGNSFPVCWILAEINLIIKVLALTLAVV